MTATTFLPSVLALAAVLLVSRHSRELRPRTAAVLLAAGCVVGVATTFVAVASVVIGQLAEVPWLAARLGWCTRAATTPAGLVAVVGGAGMLVCGLRAGAMTARRQRRHRSVSTDPVVVVESTVPHAVAVPGRPGQVVVTTGLLAVLEPVERRAVLAHEFAHLRLHHDRYLRIATVSAAALPLLRPVRDHLRFAVECWADESAATEVGSRSTVASALLKVALAGGPGETSPGALAIGGADIARRVACSRGRLHRSAGGSPAPRRRPGRSRQGWLSPRSTTWPPWPPGSADHVLNRPTPLQVVKRR